MEIENSSNNRRAHIVLFNMTLSGGAGKYIVTLAKALKNLETDVEIIIYKDAVDYEIPQDVQLHRLPGDRTKETVLQLKKKLDSLRPVDLIFSNSTPSNKILSQLKLPNAYHIVHSAETKNYTGPLAFIKRWWRKRTYKKLYSGKHLITVSKGLETYITKTLEASPLSIRTTYNPFDFEEIRKQANENDPTLPKEPYIIHVGRLDIRSKRHDILLKAYKRAGVSHKLVLLGQGPDKGKIEDIIDQLGLRKKVVLPGFRINPYP